MQENPRRIDATQTRHKAAEGKAVLVCAYEDESKCQDLLIDGAISLAEFQANEDMRSKDEEIIFYCACPDEATSARVAGQYAKGKGFEKVRILLGGVEAWKQGGYPMAAETPPENPAGPEA